MGMKCAVYDLEVMGLIPSPVETGVHIYLVLLFRLYMKQRYATFHTFKQVPTCG